MFHKHLSFMYQEGVLELFENFRNAQGFLLYHGVIYLCF